MQQNLRPRPEHGGNQAFAKYLPVIPVTDRLTETHLVQQFHGGFDD
jgi:hypothetical protein